MSKDKIKKRKTYEVRFTRSELAHIRDLFSVVFPPDTRKTLSQQLAEVEDRVFLEDRLWEKLTATMKEANLPLGEEAPDHIVAPIGPPPMGIFPFEQEDVDPQEEPED